MDEKKQKRDNFINECIAARIRLFKVLLAYENLEQEDNEQTSKHYPFGSSYDEWLCEYDYWLESLITSWTKKTFEYSPTLTVGDLKKLLNKLDDSTQVVVDNNNNWWLNIVEVELPDDESMFTLTLRTADTFNLTQF